MAANPEFMYDEAGMLVSQAELEDQARAQAEMADEQLLTSIREREDMAYGDDADSITTDRARAIDYYLGRPFGNELEGRSAVVSKDLYDTVESILPVMQRIFAAGDDICEFQPEEEADIQKAEQESDYTNYVIQRKNPWFMLSYVWFKDALITRNAYAWVNYEKVSEPTLERYDGLTTDQLTLIAHDPEVEIIKHSQRQIPAPVPQQMVLAAAAQGVMQAFPSMTVHDVELRRRREYGCTKITVLPPERCLVAHDAAGMSVRDSNFFEYWELKTITDLRIEGFDVPDDLSDSGTRGVGDTQIDLARDSQQTVSYQRTSDDTGTDPAMRKVKTRCVWLRNDYDGDGIAELRYVVLVGDTILANEEVASIPVASIVPYPMPHRHLGLSIYDAVGDLQLIKSAMLRAGIDNQFLANNGRTAVDKNLVNLDDMQVSRPGGMVRVDGPPAAAIMPFVHPQTTEGTMRMMDYLDAIRQDRGGVQKPLAGADMDAIMAQPGTIAQLATAASQKLELIARIFGEGVKELFQIVHEVTLTNATGPDKVQLRGQWVTVDPRQWKKRKDMTLTVGMGVGNKQSHAAGISALIGLQEKAVAVGLTDLNKLFAGYSEFTKALGFGNAKQFFTEPPPGTRPPPPPPPPQVIAAQIKAAVDERTTAFDGQVKVLVEQIKQNGDANETRFKEFMQILNDREERMLRAYSEATERAQELRLARAEGGGKGSVDIPVAMSFKGYEEKLGDMQGKFDSVMESLTGLGSRIEEVAKEAKKPRRRRLVRDEKGKAVGSVEESD